MSAREKTVRSLVIISLGALLLSACRDDPGQPGFQIPDRGEALLVDLGGVSADPGLSSPDPGNTPADPGPAPTDPGPKDEGADLPDTADTPADLGEVVEDVVEDAVDAQDPGTPDVADEGDAAVDAEDAAEDTVEDTEEDVGADAEEDAVEDVPEDTSEQGPLAERCGTTQIVVSEPLEGEAVYHQTDGDHVVWLQKRTLAGQQVEHLYWWSGQDPAQRYTETGQDVVSRRTELHLKDGVAFFVERRVDFDVVMTASADAVAVNEVDDGGAEHSTFRHLRSDGTRAVWSGVARAAGADGPSAVYYFDGSTTGTPADPGADAVEPVVLGTKVAWSQSEGEDPAKVLLYEGGSTVFFAEGDSEEVGAGDKIHPHLSGGNLIWVSQADGQPPQLHIYNGTAASKLTDVGLLDEYSFDALGDEVVWIERADAGSAEGKRMRRLSGGQSSDVAENLANHQGIHSPRLATDFVAWVQMRDSNNGALWLQQGGGADARNLSDVVPSDRTPQVVSSYAIGGGIVAYAVGPADNSGIVVGTPEDRRILGEVLGGAVLSIEQTEGEAPVHPIEHETVAGGVVVFRMVAPPEAEWVWVSLHNGCSE